MKNTNKKSNIKATKSIFKYLTIIIFSLIIVILIYFVSNNKINHQNQKETIGYSIIHVPIIKNKLYTNSDFGFSLNLPEKIAIKGCNKNPDGSYDIGFTDQSVLAPSIIFYDKKYDVFYITTEFFYVGTDVRKVQNKYNSYDVQLFDEYFKCQKETTTLASIKNPSEHPDSLTFFVGNTKNDNELEKFIQSVYGPLCNLGKKTASSKENVFNVTVINNNEEGMNNPSKCWAGANSMLIEFNHSKGKTVIFDLGQEIQIGSPIDNSNVEGEILDSFKFD